MGLIMDLDLSRLYVYHSKRKNVGNKELRLTGVIEIHS